MTKMRCTEIRQIFTPAKVVSFKKGGVGVCGLECESISEHVKTTEKLFLLGVA